MTTFMVIPNDVLHVITMTGELVDLFPNRHSGVLKLQTTLKHLLSSDSENIVFMLQTMVLCILSKFLR
jgi:uncharacterized hydantoinase/oxoprolinase family protein